MDNYLNVFLESNISINDPIALISLLFLFFGRMLPIISQAPFFGARILPRPTKTLFAICIFFIFFPQLTYVVTTPIAFNMMLVLFLLKEIFVGSLIGYMLTIPFLIVQNAGILIDHQRGGASLMVNDPTIQNQSSPLGTIFNLILIYLFFVTDGPFLVLDIISQSYNILPPDRFLSVDFFNLDTQFVLDLMKIMGKIMIVSTQLAAPALIMILMTDFFLGIANRLAPQVQITFLGMPLKSLLALTIIFFGWQLLIGQFVTETNSWVAYLYQMIELFKPSPR